MNYSVNSWIMATGEWDFSLTCLTVSSRSRRYDRKDTTKIILEDIQFVAAMGPPGGGRNVVTPRFIRHFMTIAINPFTDETLTKIFSTLFSVYIRVRAL